MTLARVVVLVSGRGSNLQALLDASAGPDYPAGIVGVVSNRSDAYALERARAADVPTAVVEGPRGFNGSREDFDAALTAAVSSYEPDIIVMAGFMHIVSPLFFNRFATVPILNVHPALLPENPSADTVTLPDGTQSPVWRGAHALRDALAAGVRWTGTTVHYVTLEVDRGPVLASKAVPIQPDDTLDALRARIQAVEHRLLPEAVRQVGSRIRQSLPRT